MLAEQYTEDKKIKYASILGFPDVEKRVDVLAKKNRRLGKIITKIVAELISKKQKVISCFQGYNKQGKMILDWKLADIESEKQIGHHQNKQIYEEEDELANSKTFEDRSDDEDQYDRLKNITPRGSSTKNKNQHDLANNFYKKEGNLSSGKKVDNTIPILPMIKKSDNVKNPRDKMRTGLPDDDNIRDELLDNEDIDDTIKN